MASDYGWTYSSCDAVVTGAAGDEGGIQFKTGATHLSGSWDFIYATASSNVGLGLSGPNLPQHKLHVIGDVSVTGTIFARQFNTEYVSSSVVYSSGSTKFGDTTGDIHEFTGSLAIGGTGNGVQLTGSATDFILKVGGANIGGLGNSSSDFVISSSTSDKDIIFKGSDGGSGITALTLDMSEAGAATFNNKVTAAGAHGFVAGNATLTTSELDVSSGDFTLDVAGDIVLDAGGADVLLKDDGTLFGGLVNSSTDLVISSSTSDKDIIFKGSDGGSAVTALTIDMSEAGTLLANNDLKLNTDSSVFSMGDGADFSITHDGSTGATIAAGSSGLNVDVAGDITLDTGDQDIFFKNNGNLFGAVHHKSGGGALQLSASIDSQGLELVGATTSDITIDSARDIILDADGADIFLKDGGSLHGGISRASDALVISASIDGGGGAGGLKLVGATTSDITVDSARDIILDADGADIVFKDNGTQIGTITMGGGFSAAGLVISGTLNNSGLDLRGPTNADITIDSARDIVLDADGGDVTFKDGGTNAINFNMSTTAGACYINNGAGNTVIAVDDGDRNLYFYDKGGEYIAGDGTSLKIVSGRDIILRPGGTAGSTGANSQVSISGTLAVSGTIVADSYRVVEYTEMHSTGSTKLGNSEDDRHEFTGSITIGGGSAELSGSSTSIYWGLTNTGPIGGFGQPEMNNFIISASQSDKDIVFKGSDGGTAVTALTLDMSEAGNAIFTANVSASVNVSASAFYGDGSNLTNVGGGTVSSYTNSGDNRIITSVNSSTINGEANLLFDGTKLSVTGGVGIDKNHSDTTATTITGLEIDFDKTGASTSNNTIYGVNIDVDNTTATNGANTMYGLSCTPTLTHAADAGTPVVYGAFVSASGGGNGGGLGVAAKFAAGGSDTNYGLIIDCEDGGTDLRIESSADSGDYFQIQTTTHGATTITTYDDDASAADLTFSVDGKLDLNPVGALGIDAGGDITLDADGGDIFLKDGGVLFGGLANSSTDFVISSSVSDKDIIFRGSDGGAAITALTIDMSNAGTLSASNDLKLITDSSVFSMGFHDDFSITHDGTTGATIAGNPITLDSGGDITLDADGGDIIFKDGGTLVGHVYRPATTDKLQISASINAGGLDIVGATNSDITLDSAANVNLDATTATLFKAGGSVFGGIKAASGVSADLVISSSVSDKDIIFKGSDGGSAVTAMTIDMSSGGYMGIGTTDPPSKLSVSGSMAVNYTKGTMASAPDDVYSVGANDHFINVSGTAATKYVVLPSAASVGRGRMLVIKDGSMNAASHNIVISSSAAGTKIDNAGSISITSNSGSVSLVSDGVSQWLVY